MFLCNDFVWPIGQLEQEKGGHFLSSFSFAHYCTEVHFVSFLSGGFTTTYDSNKSTRKEIGKTHLCALHCMEFENKSGKMPSFDAV